MTPDPITLEAACMTRSASEAAKYLKGLGFDATESACATMISRLIADRKRPLFPNHTFGEDSEPRSISAFDAQLGCKRLCERMEAVYDKRVEAKRCSFEAARISLLYSRRQIERMYREATLAAQLDMSMALS